MNIPPPPTFPVCPKCGRSMAPVRDDAGECVLCTMEHKERKYFTFDEFAETEDIELAQGKLYLNGSVSFLHAAPGVGKSFVALDLACRRAAGLPWLGSSLTPGTTLYVYTESAKRLWKRRRAWERENSALVTDSLIVRPGRFQLNNQGYIELRTFCQQSQVDFVIIDNLLTTSTGKDASSQKEMGEYLDNALRLAEDINGHVMLVHHDNRSGDYFGSMMIDAVADTRIHLTRDDDSSIRHLVTEKNRDLPEFSVDIELVPVEVRPGQYSCIVRETSPYQAAVQKYLAQEVKIKEAISEINDCDRESACEIIKKKMSCNQSQAGMLLNQWVEDGRLTRSGSGKRGDGYRYSNSCFSTVARPTSG